MSISTSSAYVLSFEHGSRSPMPRCSRRALDALAVTAGPCADGRRHPGNDGGAAEVGIATFYPAGSVPVGPARVAACTRCCGWSGSPERARSGLNAVTRRARRSRLPTVRGAASRRPASPSRARFVEMRMVPVPASRDIDRLVGAVHRDDGALAAQPRPDAGRRSSATSRRRRGAARASRRAGR